MFAIGFTRYEFDQEQQAFYIRPDREIGNQIFTDKVLKALGPNFSVDLDNPPSILTGGLNKNSRNKSKN